MATITNKKKNYEYINGELWITCRCCKQKKKSDSFVKCASNTTGYSTLCKECKKIEDRKYYEAIRNNPDK